MSWSAPPWLRRVDLRDAPAALVLVIAFGGLIYAAVFREHWLRGVLLLAGAMVLGGVLRAMLPARQAGLLAVRSRPFDVLCYLGLGSLMIVLGLYLRSVGRT